MKLLPTLALCLGTLMVADSVSAQIINMPVQANGFYPFVIARPEDRQWIRNMPIEDRPARPLHFYGNRVRQTYTVGPTNRNLRTSRPIGVQRILRRF